MGLFTGLAPHPCCSPSIQPKCATVLGRIAAGILPWRCAGAARGLAFYGRGRENVQFDPMLDHGRAAARTPEWLGSARAGPTPRAAAGLGACRRAPPAGPGCEPGAGTRREVGDGPR